MFSNLSNNTISRYAFLILFFAFITGCATQPPIDIIELPGFFSGLLHGFIICFSFVASWFSDYTIYAYPNSGFWYNFGFILGASMFLGGGGAGSKKKW